LQGTKTAVTHVTEVRCAVNAIWNNWAGKNKTRSYNNKQGNKHYLTEIVGDEVILLDKKSNKKVRILYCFAKVYQGTHFVLFWLAKK